MTDTFHKQQIAETTEKLARDEDAPQLGVHVMSEYIYCRRAGIIAAESREDDSGAEFIAAPALGGVPTHEVDRLEAALERLTRSLQQVGLLFLGVLVIIAVVTAFDRSLAVVLLIGAIVGAIVTGRFFWWDEVKRYLYCKKRLREARRAAKREPNWDLNAQQEVHWWELIQSGFDSRELNQSLYNPDINLKGRPWRILRRGDKHIPVIRIRVADYNPGNLTQVRLREQQRARIAAYAYLIETCERGQADWAIVLFNRSDHGLAVPLGQHDWRAFRDGLLEARAEFLRLRENMRYHPSPPEGRRACARCPLGQPRRVGKKPTVLGGSPLPAFATSDREDRASFHCTCGDRFQDVPPHEDAQKLGLLD